MNFSEPFLRAVKCFWPNELFFFPLVKVTYFLFICFPWNCLSEVPTHLYFVCHRVGETPRLGRQTQRKADTHKPPGSYVASSVQSSVPSDRVCETGSKQDFLWGSGGGGEEKGGLRGRPNVERERLREGGGRRVRARAAVFLSPSSSVSRLQVCPWTRHVRVMEDAPPWFPGAVLSGPWGYKEGTEWKGAVCSLPTGRGPGGEGDPGCLV